MYDHFSDGIVTEIVRFEDFTIIERFKVVNIDLFSLKKILQ